MLVFVEVVVYWASEELELGAWLLERGSCRSDHSFRSSHATKAYVTKELSLINWCRQGTNPPAHGTQTAPKLVQYGRESPGWLRIQEGATNLIGIATLRRLDPSNSLRALGGDTGQDPVRRDPLGLVLFEELPRQNGIDSRAGLRNQTSPHHDLAC